MIRKLRIKFIFTIMLTVLVLLAVIFGSVIYTTHSLSEKQSRRFMEEIASRDGSIEARKPSDQNQLPFPSKSIESRTDFTVKLTNGGDIITIQTDPRLTYDLQEMTAQIKTAYEDPDGYGTTGTMRYLVVKNDYGYIAVFTDRSNEMNLLSLLTRTSLLIGLASMIFVLALAIGLTNWAIKPVKEAFERQRRFIADASHELRTPITIIGTNADVLESEIGDNKWLGYIKSQTERMSGLVTSLLQLAKMDDQAEKMNYSTIDLPSALMKTILPFESTIFENGLTLETDFEQGMSVKGDETKLMQTVAILVDNAIKHARKGTAVRCECSLSGSKRHISVRNEGDGIAPEEYEKIFERFYRADSSRIRETGGYGLGLAIARSIVEAHGGRITVEGEKGSWIKFTIII